MYRFQFAPLQRSWFIGCQSQETISLHNRSSRKYTALSLSLSLSLTLILSSLSHSVYHSVKSLLYLSQYSARSLHPFLSHLFLPPSMSLLLPPSYFHLLFLSPFINLSSLTSLFLLLSIFFLLFPRSFLSHSLPLYPRLLLSRPFYPFPAFPLLSCSHFSSFRYSFSRSRFFSLFLPLYPSSSSLLFTFSLRFFYMSFPLFLLPAIFLLFNCYCTFP